MAVASVSARGQIALPKEIREAVGRRNGDGLSLALDGERVVLTPLPVARKGNWRQWRGSLAGTKALQEHLREHAEEVRRERLS
ncbi:MAG: AbrB/MazE/SpoVT family DNA-binding domain-containing protein [Thermodesulfobacteriota bacterium]